MIISTFLLLSLKPCDLLLVFIIAQYQDPSYTWFGYPKSENKEPESKTE